MIRKILCPVDFSASSLNALYFACYLAKKTNAEKLHLVTVQNGRITAGVYNNSVFNLLTEGKFSESLDVFVKNALEKTKTSVEINTELIVSDKKISTVLIEKAEKESFDLVCMGTEGVNKLKKHILGSTTKNVLEKIHCHLLAIPLEASFHGIEKIAMGVDFQYFQKEGFEWVYEFAAQFSAHLHLFDVNIANNPLLEDKMNKIKDELSHLQNLSLSLTDAIEVVAGIVDFSKKHQPDLLVLLSKNYSLLDRLFERSYTEKLILHTNVPVLALKSGKVLEF